MAEIVIIQAYFSLFINSFSVRREAVMWDVRGIVYLLCFQASQLVLLLFYAFITKHYYQQIHHSSPLLTKRNDSGWTMHSQIIADRSSVHDL